MKRCLQRSFAAAVLFAAPGLAGCARDSAPPLRPEAFGRAQEVRGKGTPQPIDRPGALIYDSVHPDPAAANPRDETAPEVKEISPAVRETVRPPGENDHSATTVPASREGAAAGTTAEANGHAEQGPSPDGQFELVGSVVATVNGKPIWANKIVASRESALAAEAKNYSAPGFRVIAWDLVRKRLQEEINSEVEFAAAQRALDKKDEALANAVTSQWRQEQIAKAGGSLELAKRRAAEDGEDFEQRVQDQNRLNLVRIYYQKRVWPKTSVTQADIRRYYNDNQETKFTEHAQVQFRLIKVDAKRLKGGHAEAMNKINEIRKRWEKGEDFDQLATSDKYNDDASVGSPQAVQKGAFRETEVEDAVWKLQPGDVSAPVDTGNSVYLARLESRTAGKVKRFEDPEVQESIRQTLRGQQFVALRMERQAELQKDAVVVIDEDRAKEIMMQLVMQRYPRWAAR